MKRLLITFLYVLFFGTSCIEDSISNNGNSDESFSRWMDNDNLLNYVNNEISDSNYILLVEGRLNNSVNEYRVYLSKKPEKAFYWYWYYNQTESKFNSLKMSYESDSVDLVNYQTFTDVNNTLRYQVTFRKIIY